MGFADIGGGDIVLTRLARGNDPVSLGGDGLGNSMDATLATAIDDDAICSITLSLKVHFAATTPASMKVDLQSPESLFGVGGGAGVPGSLPRVADRGGADASVIFGIGDGSGRRHALQRRADRPRSVRRRRHSGQPLGAPEQLRHDALRMETSPLADLPPSGVYFDSTGAGFPDQHPRMFVSINNPYGIGQPSAGNPGFFGTLSVGSFLNPISHGLPNIPFLPPPFGDGGPTGGIYDIPAGLAFFPAGPGAIAADDTDVTGVGLNGLGADVPQQLERSVRGSRGRAGLRQRHEQRDGLEPGLAASGYSRNVRR